jgi:hypothetical protein
MNDQSYKKIKDNKNLEMEWVDRTMKRLKDRNGNGFSCKRVHDFSKKFQCCLAKCTWLRLPLVLANV